MNYVKTTNEKLEWKEAIRKTASILVEEGCATDQLAEEIIKSTNEMGPYYVLMPNVALLHTHPGPYCKENQIGLMLSKHEIEFGDGDMKNKAKVLFILSATDGESHMGVISKLANFLGDDTKSAKLLEMANNQKIDEKILEEIWR